MKFDFRLLKPDWNIPNVKAFTVLALSTNSSFVDFNINNLNGQYFRQKLEEYINPKYPINWLKQVHGNSIIELPDKKIQEADGSFTTQKGVVCEVVTADCLPIVFANFSGSIVGIVHAGRRGLHKNIISNLVDKLNVPIDEIIVWIGPGISQKNYLVSEDIRQDFIKSSIEFDIAFKFESNKYLMDLHKIAKMQLLCLGILNKNIYGAEWDTFSSNLMHSARRDKTNSGRMVTVVWLE